MAEEEAETITAEAVLGLVVAHLGGTVEIPFELVEHYSKGFGQQRLRIEPDYDQEELRITIGDA